MYVPEYLKPTKKTNNILLGLFIGVMIISIFQFPLGSIMSGKTDVKFTVGWPVPFLILDFDNTSRNPFLMVGIFADLLFYLVIGYWADVLLTVSEKEVKKIFKELLEDMRKKREKERQTKLSDVKTKTKPVQKRETTEKKSP